LAQGVPSAQALVFLSVTQSDLCISAQ